MKLNKDISVKKNDKPSIFINIDEKNPKITRKLNLVIYDKDNKTK